MTSTKAILFVLLNPERPAQKHAFALLNRLGCSERPRQNQYFWCRRIGWAAPNDQSKNNAFLAGRSGQPNRFSGKKAIFLCCGIGWATPNDLHKSNSF